MFELDAQARCSRYSNGTLEWDARTRCSKEILELDPRTRFLIKDAIFLIFAFHFEVTNSLWHPLHKLWITMCSSRELRLNKKLSKSRSKGVFMKWVAYQDHMDLMWLSSQVSPLNKSLICNDWQLQFAAFEHSESLESKAWNSNSLSFELSLQLSPHQTLVNLARMSA